MFKNLLDSFKQLFGGTAVPVRLRINGFHTGSGGFGVPKEMYTALDAADIPFMAKTADGSLFDAIQIARARVDAGKANIHSIVYRRSVRLPDGIVDPNVPSYDKSPYEAAAQHWAYHKALFPVEVRDNRDLVWVETINEPDKDSPGVTEWLASFAIETARMAMADGYRWAAFGWAGGNPEPEHWRGPKMVEFLRLCAANPDKVAVALHEYSWTVDDIWNGRTLTAPGVYKYDLIGRFTRLISACDEFGISPYPTIMITEWGWAERNVPAPEKAILDVLEVGKLYGRYSNVKGAAVWYLGAGFGEVHKQTQALVVPLWNALLTKTYEVAPVEPLPPDPDPEPGFGLPRVQYSRVMFVAPQDSSLEDWLAICKAAYAGRRSVGFSHDDGGIGALDNKTAVLYGIALEKHAEFLDWYAEHYLGTAVQFENTPAAPAAFSLTHWPTQYKIINQHFGANPGYYTQFGLPGHEGIDIRAYDSTKVFAAAPGKVYVVETNPSAGNYGIHVRIEHVGGYKTVYAHLKSASVTVGQVVAGGQLIGLADSTGNSSGSHLHLTMKHPAGQAGWPYEIVDPTPWLRPLAPELFPEAQPPQDTYTGPQVSFVAGVDGPASDWRWPEAKKVFDTTKLAPKFHAGGTNHQWFSQYKHPVFNLARILVAPDFNGDIYKETVGNVAQWFSMGVRDFEVLNEPNLEGMGVRWSNGAEFGAAFKDLCARYKAQFPGIRLWFPGMSPGFGAQYAFIDAAVSVGAFDYIFGVCEHVYTGIVDNETTAVDQMADEVMEFRKRYALKRPLCITEFSVNRPAPAAYKAAVYHKFYDRLAAVPGVQAAYSFTASWYPSGDSNQEGWLEYGIYNAF